MVSGKVESAANSDQVSEMPSASNSGTKDEQAVIPKQSYAVRLWALLIVAVLTILGLQMRSGVPIYNLLVETDATAIGANVAVDGKPVGVIQRLDQGGIKINGVRTFIPSGEHTLTVNKDGYQPYQHQFNLRAEDYFNVVLKPTTPPVQNSKTSQTIQLPGPSSADPKDGQTIQLPGPSK